MGEFNFFEESDIDSLTGNASSVEILEKLKALCQKAVGVLALIDLDNSEIFNGVYGYDMGEELYQTCAEIISGNIAEDDVIGRLGGDEFVVLINGVTDQLAFTRFYKKIYEQINEAAKKLVGEDMRITLSISAGAVFLPRHGNQYDELFQKANVALEYVKRTGGQNCAFYSEGSGIDENLVVDKFDKISRDLDETVSTSGAMWVDYDKFSAIYRFMKRYMDTYGGTASRMLITITPADSMNREDFNIMTRELGKIISSTLRDSDLMMQSRQNQFYLLLSGVKENQMAKISSRIVSTWKKTRYASISEIHFDAGIIKGKNDQ